MQVISFNGANLVAQQLDWSMTEGWGQGDAAANAYYSPIETFAERFAAFITLVRDAGFDSVDVWTGQLNWAWATEAHLEAARVVLKDSGVTVASYAGAFGATPAELRSACATAAALGTSILGGNCELLFTDRSAALAILRDTGLRLAIENHPESSPQQIARAVTRLLREPRLADELVAGGHRILEGGFSRAHSAQGFADLFERCMR